MKPLIWVEVVDRHGDVASRHPVHAFPFRIGRAYSCDVVIDDPHVAGEHLEINALDEGRFQLSDLATVNGMTIDTQAGKQTDAVISAQNRVRIGHTQLRIRPVDFIVAAEKHLPADTWQRKWTALLIALPFLMLAYFVSLWAEYDRAEFYRLILQPMLLAMLCVLLWAGFWSIVKRGGWANFTAHTVIACFGISTLLLLNEQFLNYVGFVVNAEGSSTILTLLAEPLVIGTMLYHHVRLVSRTRRRNVAMIVAALTLVSTAFFHLDEMASKENDFTNMPYSRTVPPPALVVFKGKPFEAFLSSADRLKNKADKP